MDGILDGFETWSDHIICLKVISPLLLKKPIFDYHQHNLFSFDLIFLELTD